MVEMRNPFHAPPSYTGEIDVLLLQMIDDHATVDDATTALDLSGPLAQEIQDAVRVTRLRAEQVFGLYTYVDNLLDFDDSQRMAALADARAALDEEWAIAQAREALYRVPADRIAAWRENPTAYSFTYLWTARSFYFWWRDEGKAVDGPASPCYENIIDPADVGMGEGLVQSGAELIQALLDGGFLEDLGECLAGPTSEPSYPQDDLRSRP
jgi:hypothetical protein